MRRALLILAVVLPAACATTPSGEPYYSQARGPSAADTALNLLEGMEAAAARARRAAPGALAELAARRHALRRVLAEAKRTPRSDEALTLAEEMGVVLERLQGFPADRPRREAHLALLETRLHELRELLQAWVR